MSNPDVAIEKPVVDAAKAWIRDTASEQIDDLVQSHNPEADLPLRGESITLSIESLAEYYADDGGDELVKSLVTPGDNVRASVTAAVARLVKQRVGGDVELPSEGAAWNVNWTDPVDEMYVDISKPLSQHDGKVVAVRGRIRHRTDPVPWLRARKYVCNRCLTSQRDRIEHHPRDVVRGHVREPAECEDETCSGGRNDFVVDDEGSDKRDYQYLTVEQEAGESGSTPSKIECWVFGEGRLTQAREGERVTIVGELRLNPEAEPSEHYIDVLGISTDREDNTVDVTDDDRERILDLVGEMDEPLETATDNLAPHVHGNDLAKRGLVLAAAGSGLADESEQTHTLLIGDPGTAKTELTKAVREAIPSTRQASLTQSSSVGLTASAVKEQVGNREEWIIRAGALSLASGGILTVDELDKADFDLNQLNDALSEGEVPVDKAGESTKVKMDTRVIATANPKGSKFTPRDGEPLDEQIQFDADVVSRFDLAFPFRDDASDEAMNRGIMRATAADYLDEEEMSEKYEAYTREIELETFQKWLAVAQEHNPTITEEAMDEIEEAWMLLRDAQSQGGAIKINARRLRTVVRLARAHSRLRLGDEVTSKDAEVAMRTVSAMLGQWGYDITGSDSGTDNEADSGDVERQQSELDDDTSHSLSDRKRESVREMASETEMDVEEIREELRIPPSQEAETKRLVEAVRDGLGSQLAHTGGGSDD